MSPSCFFTVAHDNHIFSMFARYYYYIMYYYNFIWGHDAIQSLLALDVFSTMHNCFSQKLQLLNLCSNINDD